MIYGIATRIDLLEFIMHGDTATLSGDNTATNGSGIGQWWGVIDTTVQQFLSGDLNC